MTQQTGNLRVRRTQKLLREALIALIEERGFEALTIGEITARALVSRAAFYRNYQDKYALVEQIFAEAMDALFAAIGALGQEHPAGVWVRFFEHIATYEQLYHALLGKSGSPWFVRKMREALAALIVAQGHASHMAGSTSHDNRPLPDGLVADLVSTMFVEAIIWWLEHERPYTPNEIATRTALLAAAIFREAITWQ